MFLPTFERESNRSRYRVFQEMFNVQGIFRNDTFLNFNTFNLFKNALSFKNYDRYL